MALYTISLPRNAFNGHQVGGIYIFHPYPTLFLRDISIVCYQHIIPDPILLLRYHSRTFPNVSTTQLVEELDNNDRALEDLKAVVELSSSGESDFNQAFCNSTARKPIGSSLNARIEHELSTYNP